MRNLVIAPTATWKKKTDSIFNVPNDHTDAVEIKQKLDKIIPKGTNKGAIGVVQKHHFDMRQIHHLHERNRQKDLEVYDNDLLYQTRPLYGVSYPEMKLRKQS
jgi:hypothetical protein